MRKKARKKALEATKKFNDGLREINDFVASHNEDFIAKVAAPYDKAIEKAKEMKATTPKQVADVAAAVQRVLEERADAIQKAWEKILFPDGNVLKLHAASNLESLLAITPKGPKPRSLTRRSTRRSSSSTHSSRW
jgi:hypothetical protein